MSAKGKFTKQKIEKILDLKASGQYPNYKICIAVGISEDTLYRWLEEKPDFKNLFHEAEEKSIKRLGEISKSALIRKMEGYDYEEISQEGVKTPSGLVVTNIKKTKKHIPPSDTAIIFAWKIAYPNLVPAENVNMNVSKNNNLSTLSDEELSTLENIRSKLDSEQ